MRIPLTGFLIIFITGCHAPPEPVKPSPPPAVAPKASTPKLSKRKPIRHRSEYDRKRMALEAKLKKCMRKLEQTRPVFCGNDVEPINNLIASLNTRIEAGGPPEEMEDVKKQKADILARIESLRATADAYLKAERELRALDLELENLERERLRRMNVR